MIRAALVILGLLLAPAIPAAQAQTSAVAPGSVYMREAPDLYEMFQAMGLYEMLGIMAEEHADGAAAIEAALFPGEGGAAWQARTGALCTQEHLISLFEENFPQDALGPDDIATVTAFMQSETGQRLISGEIAARRAFLEEGAQEAGADALMAALETDDVRVETLIAFNEVNDLIERNVSGAMNARLAYFRGLVDGGAFEDDMAEDFMLSDVWAQEPQIRQATVEWLYAFQITAYQDLENADLEAYVAHSETEAGQAMIAALFQTFDVMLEELSYDIGYAAAGFTVGEDI